MDALSSIFSNIGGFLTNSPAGATGLGAWSGGPDWGNLAKTIGVAGLGDQFINNWLQQQKLNQYNAQQQQFQKNPLLAQNQITQMTQPLNQNLVAAVNNQVQGQLGSEGLAESPNIQASVLSQALAPFYQQNQTQATNLWEAIHGQPPAFGQSNMNPLFAMLLRGFGNNTGSNAPANSNPLQYLIPQWNNPNTTTSDPSLGANDLSNWGLSTGYANA